MTFEEYKQGLMNIVNNGDDEKERFIYNKTAQQECDFSINLGVLGSALKRESRFGSAEVDYDIMLSPIFDNRGNINRLTGIVTVNMVYIIPEGKRVVEEWARFSINENTKLKDGSVLKYNVYAQSNYGDVRLYLMPETNIKDLIVKLNLNAQYMNYPIFVKALMSCNVIENNEEILSK